MGSATFKKKKKKNYPQPASPSEQTEDRAGNISDFRGCQGEVTPCSFHSRAFVLHVSDRGAAGEKRWLGCPLARRGGERAPL